MPKQKHKTHTGGIPHNVGFPGTDKIKDQDWFITQVRFSVKQYQEGLRDQEDRFWGTGEYAQKRLTILTGNFIPKKCTK